MQLEHFLNRVYDHVYPGIKVLVPRRQTEILSIRENGDIVYLVASAYRKTLSRTELADVFMHLDNGPVSTAKMRQIVTPARTCNVSTIKWILQRCDLARQDDGRYWVRNW